MKAIELKDFLQYKFLNNIRISPDKSSAVFGVAMCDEENNAYKQNIYLYRNGKVQPLTQSGKVFFWLLMTEIFLMWDAKMRKRNS